MDYLYDQRKFIERIAINPENQYSWFLKKRIKYKIYYNNVNT